MGTGQDFSTPLTGLRRKIYNYVITNDSYLMLLCFGYRVKHVYHKIDEIDYSKYLGPEWRKNKFKGNRVSTIVSNHCGILDIFAFASGQSSSFTPSAHVKTFPCICGLGKFYCDVTQCVYCDRGAT